MLDLFLRDPRQYLVTLPPLLCLHYYHVFLRFDMIINIIQLLFDFLFMEHNGLFGAKLRTTKHFQITLLILWKILWLKVTISLLILFFLNWLCVLWSRAIFNFTSVYVITLTSKDANILIVLGNKLCTCVQSSFVGWCLLLIECFLPNFLYKSLRILYKIRIALTMQMTVPAFWELDTLVNAEVLPLL